MSFLLKKCSGQTREQRAEQPSPGPQWVTTFPRGARIQSLSPQEVWVLAEMGVGKTKVSGHPEGPQREAEKTSWGRDRRAQLTMASRLSRSSGMVKLGREASSSFSSSSISSSTADSQRDPSDNPRGGPGKKGSTSDPSLCTPGPASPEINSTFRRLLLTLFHHSPSSGSPPWDGFTHLPQEEQGGSAGPVAVGFADWWLLGAPTDWEVSEKA